MFDLAKNVYGTVIIAVVMLVLLWRILKIIKFQSTAAAAENASKRRHALGVKRAPSPTNGVARDARPAARPKVCRIPEVP